MNLTRSPFSVWNLVDRFEVAASTFEHAQEVRLAILSKGYPPAEVRISDNSTGHDLTPVARRRGRPVRQDREPRSVNIGSLRLRPRTLLWLNAQSEAGSLPRLDWLSDLLDDLAGGQATIARVVPS